ncbi:MAG TPA: Type 1 glutamine amidotransferase-like domain-containing protein [Candidatus Binatia bacterium]|nr:Type 1 glutamine amidotransferase-like domain-containing protein [Candidatus Binatia bacterium]
MPGAVALVGAGEFLPRMADVDRRLLEATGARRPRVAILPTASYPDGALVFRRWAEAGVAHFRALGAEVEAVLVRDAVDADDPAYAQAVGEADLVYLSGGKPTYLLRTLAGSAVWRAALAAYARGAVLAGCSAGAMVLAARQPRFRRRLLFPLAWDRGLGLVPGIAVLPHYDRLPEPIAALVALQAPRGCLVVGLDEDTAIVGRNGAWQVAGQARVTIWSGRHRTRYRAGDVFRFDEGGPGAR